ncbi:hypothetical protein C0995_006089 [Termitomyces sp. Mi166|nr:hypothetical protein C0995_006089 [Termitomyces sp. Mi166\
MVDEELSAMNPSKHPRYTIGIVKIKKAWDAKLEEVQDKVLKDFKYASSKKVSLSSVHTPQDYASAIMGLPNAMEQINHTLQEQTGFNFARNLLNHLFKTHHNDYDTPKVCLAHALKLKESDLKGNNVSGNMESARTSKDERLPEHAMSDLENEDGELPMTFDMTVIDPQLLPDTLTPPVSAPTLSVVGLAPTITSVTSLNVEALSLSLQPPPTQPQLQTPIEEWKELSELIAGLKKQPVPHVPDAKQPKKRAYQAWSTLQLKIADTMANDLIVLNKYVHKLCRTKEVIPLTIDADGKPLSTTVSQEPAPHRKGKENTQ